MRIMTEMCFASVGYRLYHWDYRPTYSLCHDGQSIPQRAQRADEVVGLLFCDGDVMVTVRTEDRPAGDTTDVQRQVTDILGFLFRLYLSRQQQEKG